MKDLARAKTYLRACIRDSLALDETPVASHAMLAWTEALWDEEPEQREEGLEVAKHLILKADKIALYVDYGYSRGMKEALYFARTAKVEGHPIIIEVRRIMHVREYGVSFVNAPEPKLIEASSTKALA